MNPQELATFLQYSDLMGVLVFGMSGALAAARKGMDPFGMFVLASVTAVGGGTTRSVLIGDFPVPFLRDPRYVLICVAATVLTIVTRRYWKKLEQPIRVLDALGLGVVTIIGIAVSLGKGLPAWPSLLMGVTTGIFGGILRDVLRAEIPFVFREEIYALAAFAGGALYLCIREIGAPEGTAVALGVTTVILIRLLAMRFKLSLPKIGDNA